MWGRRGFGHGIIIQKHGIILHFVYNNQILVKNEYLSFFPEFAWGNPKFFGKYFGEVKWVIKANFKGYF